jgi:hypothetical protein
MNERRASLEKGNVTAELLENTRRLKPVREASDTRSAQEHRGSGGGMRAKEDASTRETQNRDWAIRPINRDPARERPGGIGSRRGP